MKSLRETLETTFAAGAFAERNLPQEAREMTGAQGKAKDAAKRADSKTQRPRPSLKA